MNDKLVFWREKLSDVGYGEGSLLLSRRTYRFADLGVVPESVLYRQDDASLMR